MNQYPIGVLVGSLRRTSWAQLHSVVQVIIYNEDREIDRIIQTR